MHTAKKLFSRRGSGTFRQAHLNHSFERHSAASGGVPSKPSLLALAKSATAVFITHPHDDARRFSRTSLGTSLQDILPRTHATPPDPAPTPAMGEAMAAFANPEEQEREAFRLNPTMLEAGMLIRHGDSALTSRKRARPPPTLPSSADAFTTDATVQAGLPLPESPRRDLPITEAEIERRLKEAERQRTYEQLCAIPRPHSPLPPSPKGSPSSTYAVSALLPEESHTAPPKVSPAFPNMDFAAFRRENEVPRPRSPVRQWMKKLDQDRESGRRNAGPFFAPARSMAASPVSINSVEPEPRRPIIDATNSMKKAFAKGLKERQVPEIWVNPHVNPKVERIRKWASEIPTGAAPQVIRYLF